MDVTICDFVADHRASTPSAAAEAAVPDRAELQQLLARYRASLDARVQSGVRAGREKLERLSSHRLLCTPQALFDLRTLHLCHREERLHTLLQGALEVKSAKLAQAVAALQGRNPLSILTRGYAWVTDEQGATKTSAGAFSSGDRATLHFGDGRVHVAVEQVEPKQTSEGSI